MSLLHYPGACLLLILSLSLTACQDKPHPPEKGPQPAAVYRVNPGMRAYVDPTTGNYAPAPPVIGHPKPLVPAAGLVSPGLTPAPREKPLPGGGVMLELGDQFQTEGRATH